MAGNSQRRGAMRNAGTKKGATVGSGGQRRKGLEGRGPTPKAEERPHHPAARRKRAAEKRAGSKSERPARSGRAPRGDTSVLAGRNPVVEAMRAAVPAKALYVQARLSADERMREAVALAVAQGVPVLEVDRVDLDRMTDGAVHQGLALAVPAYQYRDAGSLVGLDVLIALDGVTDPRNLGAIARSAAAFGAGGIVLTERRSAGVTASAWKASAGAFSHVAVAQVTNLTRSLNDFKKAGYLTVGLAAEAEQPIGDLDRDVWSDKVMLVIGGEGKGLSRLVGETCDYLVSIPMAGVAESLNASVAAGIALYTAFAGRS